MNDSVQVVIYPAKNWIDVYVLDIEETGSSRTITRGKSLYDTVPKSFMENDPRARRFKPEAKGIYSMQWNDVEEGEVERIIFMTIFEGR